MLCFPRWMELQEFLARKEPRSQVLLILANHAESLPNEAEPLSS